VRFGFWDQEKYFKRTALLNNVPQARWVTIERTGTPDQRLYPIVPALIDALTKPLTKEEMYVGTYVPEKPQRYIFKGTYDEAIDFFNATEHVDSADADINIYTDGSPIIPPTEAKVAKMLTGTSLKADTVVKDAKGNPVKFSRYETVTVEKVAIIGVMAGCKPEYMPVLLAIAEQGGGSTNCPGTSSSVGTLYIVDGPIAKQIGLSARHEFLDYGNRANVSLAKAARLMTINFGGCIAGIQRTDAGNPLSVVVAEDTPGLPPGWETVGEEFGYTRKDSVLVKIGTRGFGVNEFAPGASRRLQDGIGSIADDLGALGKSGPHNILKWLAPRIAPLQINSGHTFLIVPNLAKPLGEIFPTKNAVYEWLFNTYRATIRDYQRHGWWEFQTEIGNRVEGTNPGHLTFNQLYEKYGDDYKIPVFGARSPKENLIVVGGGGADESIWHFAAGRGPAVSIDKWR
jgi:hypothetical protein